MSHASQARAEYYFKDASCPIAVKEVEAAFSVRHPYDFTSQAHSHDFAELVIVAAGAGHQVIDGEKYPVQTGDVFLIQGESEHYFLERDRISLINVQFDPARLPLPYSWLRRISGYNVLFELEPATRSPQSFRHRLKLDPVELEKAVELARKLAAELEKENPPRALLGLQELIIFIAESYEETSLRNPGAAARIGKVISRMEADFQRDWRLDELSRLAATSVNNLLRLFREVTGTTPMDYLNKIRLRHAAGLLRRSPASISGVAGECGFNDSNYFTRKFRKLYGMTPREYRSLKIMTPGGRPSRHT